METFITKIYKVIFQFIDEIIRPSVVNKSEKQSNQNLFTFILFKFNKNLLYIFGLPLLYLISPRKQQHMLESCEASDTSMIGCEISMFTLNTL